jgi:hypothetical protein
VINLVSLVCLAEEGNEVAIEVSKGIRFGFDEPITNPESKYEIGSSAFSRLQEEIGDLLGAFDYARACNSFDMVKIAEYRAKKFQKLVKMHGQP